MYEPDYKEKKACSLLQREVKNWEEGEVAVTDKELFLMRNVVKKCRKNYFGIYDKQRDPVTGRKKLWVPMTEWIVEDIVKNIDIDTEQIKVKAKNPDSHGVASIFRYVLKYFLDEIDFGKLINQVIRLTAIDGTCFVKVWKNGKEMEARVIDRLNIIADPSANCLEDTPIIERNVLTLPEFREEAKSGGWANTEEVYGTKKIDRSGFDSSVISNNVSEIPMVDIYERYGWFEKCILTGKSEDENEYVYGLIICSGIKDKVPVCHLVKEVKSHPYTMFKFKDIWNRLDGRGVAEMLFSLQASLNETVNTRRNTARIAQMGLWKATGSITPQQIKNLFTTSVIKLKNQRDEFSRLDTGTVDPSSYRDEEFAKDWGQKVTGSFDTSTVTAATPASNALIQERGSKVGFNLVQENLGITICEMIEDKMIPIIKKLIKPGDVIRITGNAKDFQILEDKYIKNLVYGEAQKYLDQGGILDDATIEGEIERVRQELKSMEGDRYVKINDAAFDEDYSVDVTFGEEEMNPALIVQSITQALGIAAQYPGATLDVNEAIKEIFDTLGIDGNRMIKSQQTLGEAQAQMAGQEAMLANQPQMGGMGINEATMNPTPNSRPVV